MIFVRSGAVELPSEAHRPAVLRRRQHHVQIAAVEAERDRAATLIKHGAFGSDIPGSTQSPLIQRRPCRKVIYLCRVPNLSAGRREIFRASITDVGLR